MKKLACLCLVAAFGCSTMLTSCETATGTGALLGAGTGALIAGNTHGGSTGRTLVGAGLGALAGALVGSAIDRDNARQYGAVEDYPYGRPTNYPGYVRSPYRPHNLIDVRGIPEGELVLDPSVNRLFRNP